MHKDNIMLTPKSDLDEFKEKILEHIKAGKPLNGKNGILTSLAALEGEMDAHLETEVSPENAQSKEC